MDTESVYTCILSENDVITACDDHLLNLLMKRTGDTISDLRVTSADGRGGPATPFAPFIRQLADSGEVGPRPTRILDRDAAPLLEAVLQVGKGAGEGEAARVSFMGLALPQTGASQMVPRSDSVGDGFLGRLTHDLNNALSSIRTAGFLVANAHGEADRQEAKGMLDEAVDRAAEFVERLGTLDNARKGERQAVAVGSLQDALAGMIAEMPETTVAFELRGDTDGARLDIDLGGLMTALSEIVGNADRAMRDVGRPQSVAVTATVSGERRQLLIDVVDQGPGLPFEMLRSAHQPLVSSDSGRPGAGLGLSIADAFCTASGGRLDILPLPGRGTTVRMTLPVGFGEVETVAEGQTPSVEPTSEDEAMPTAKGRRILVVDDDDFDVRLVAQALTLLGYEVVSANTGAEALARLIELPDVHLLLTDVKMPEFDGMRLAESAQVWRPALPVIFMSGAVGEAAPLAEKIDAPVLRKPVAMDELGTLLQQSLTTNR
ncbi:MAG: ATP-binding protein [Pseudomonadota bacterium]